MDEQQWLTSDDPVAMLRYLETGRLPESMGANYPMQPCRVRVSDRKLRLWVEACRQFTASRSLIPVQWEANLDDPLVLHDCLATWAVGEETAHSMEESEKAALLRDIVGNPWRPVTLPRGRRKCGQCSGVGKRAYWYGPTMNRYERCRICDGSGSLEGDSCPWLTPTVRSLAEAAYDLRVGRECGRCRGSGLSGTGYGQFGGGRCSDCHGTGHIDTGTLDPDRLLILADALEEAGCDDADILNHLRSVPVTVRQRCRCGGEYRPLRKDFLPLLSACKRCYAEGPFWADVEKAEQPTHVRGCWAVDLCLGRE